MRTFTPEELARLEFRANLLPDFRAQGLSAVLLGTVISPDPKVHILMPGDTADTTFVTHHIMVQKNRIPMTWVVMDKHLVLTAADEDTADRLARYVAPSLADANLGSGCTAPSWYYGNPRSAHIQQEDITAWWLESSDPTVSPDFYDRENFPFAGIEEVDATDERRLPDGSKYIERLGLLYLARHLARRESWKKDLSP